MGQFSEKQGSKVEADGEEEMLSIGGTLLRVVCIGVIIVSVFAAVLVPLKGKRRPWPLGDAMATLRELNTAQIYYSSQRDINVYGTLEELVASKYIPDKFENGVRDGYRFEIGFGADRAHQYWIKASPVDPGPKPEYLFTNSTGQIWRSSTDFAVNEVDCTLGEGFTMISYGGR